MDELPQLWNVLIGEKQSRLFYPREAPIEGAYGYCDHLPADCHGRVLNFGADPVSGRPVCSWAIGSLC